MDYNDMYVDDVDELENQRYSIIKNSNHYIELQIIIGKEKEIMNGHTGKLPVIKQNMCHCGPEEVGNMYVVLKNMTEYYKQKYPIECALAELTSECTGIMDTNSDTNEEE